MIQPQNRAASGRAGDLQTRREKLMIDERFIQLLESVEHKTKVLAQAVETLQALAKQHDTAITAIADIMEGKGRVQPLC